MFSLSKLVVAFSVTQDLDWVSTFNLKLSVFSVISCYFSASILIVPKLRDPLIVSIASLLCCLIFELLLRRLNQIMTFNTQTKVAWGMVLIGILIG